MRQTTGGGQIAARLYWAPMTSLTDGPSPMKALICLVLAVLLSGCLPIGIRAQNLPLAGQPATHGFSASSAAARV